MEKMRQVLVANNLKLPTNKLGESSFEVRAIEQEVIPQGAEKVSELYCVMMSGVASADVRIHQAELILAWTFAML